MSHNDYLARAEVAFRAERVRNTWGISRRKRNEESYARPVSRPLPLEGEN